MNWSPVKPSLMAVCTLPSMTAILVVLPLGLLVSVGVCSRRRRSKLAEHTEAAVINNIEYCTQNEKVTRPHISSVILARKPTLLERAERFADTTAEPVVLTDATDGTIVYCNDAWVTMCGYTREEAIGRTNRELLQGAHTNMTVARELGVALAEGAPEANAKLWNYKKDGKGFWNDLYVQQIGGRSADGAACALCIGFLKEVGDDAGAQIGASNMELSAKNEGREAAETMSHDDESKMFIAVAEDGNVRCPVPSPGLRLDITASEVSDDAIRKQHEASVLVEFELPDGSQVIRQDVARAPTSGVDLARPFPHA